MRIARTTISSQFASWTMVRSGDYRSHRSNSGYLWLSNNLPGQEHSASGAGTVSISWSKYPESISGLNSRNISLAMRDI